MNVVETSMRYLLPFALLVGCQSYPTLEEACKDTLPGGENVSDPVDAETGRWMNCHRRQAQLPQVRVLPSLQAAVEGHSAYLETNKPFNDQYFQIAGNEPYTGRSGLDRARAEGWTASNGARFLEFLTIEAYEAADVFVGKDNFDLWFSNPRVRQIFLQNPSFGFSVASSSYVITFPEDSDFDDIPISLHDWNIIYQEPATPYAQTPIKYPPNGAEDVPSRYTHWFDDDILEVGGEYGYPITFTVGAAETGLTVDTAALIGPDGPVAITVINGANNGLEGLTSTAIVVPDNPLSVGQEYTCEVEITTNQGKRRARTTFRVGSREVGNFGGELAPAARSNGPVRPLLSYIIREVHVTDEHGPLQVR